MTAGRTLSNERIEFLIRDFSRGFIAYCGFVADDLSWGTFQSSLTLRPEHRQQDGFVHAGVMAAMADHTAGYAGFTTIPDTHQILTIEFKINFLRPAGGEQLLCRSRILRPGRQVLVAESEVFDQTGGEEKMAAKAQLTLMAVPWESLRIRAFSDNT